jgi:O-antigen ligase
MIPALNSSVRQDAGRLDQVGFVVLAAVSGALQFSIAVAEILLAVVGVLWVALLITRRERITFPAMFWPLLLYAAATLTVTAFSPEPRVGLLVCKQMVLFALVPLVYRFATGPRATMIATVIVSFAAASATIGIVQYAVLHYDNLGRRPQGSLGHYMTYSGLLMLVIGLALARILFARRERVWAGLVMPALAVAVTLTFTRSAWVGACAGAALLLSLKDFRLLAILPIVAAAFFAVAPMQLTARFISMFDMRDPTNRDRVAMLREGEQMIADHPLVGIGPNMVQRLYERYRDPDAVEPVNPHLHNVVVQIAAERGLPTLGIWLWFVVALLVRLAKRFRADDGAEKALAAAALAAVVSMLTAGMFEYNFGDSEFLMLFLILITLPFAASRRVPDGAVS